MTFGNSSSSEDPDACEQLQIWMQSHEMKDCGLRVGFFKGESRYGCDLMINKDTGRGLECTRAVKVRDNDKCTMRQFRPHRKAILSWRFLSIYYWIAIG